MTTAVIDTRGSEDDYLHRKRWSSPPVGSVYRFSNASSDLTMPLSENQVGNCFQPMPPAYFDRVLIDGSFPLYRTTMTLDLLAGLHDSLKPGGDLRIERASLGAGDPNRLDAATLADVHPQVVLDDHGAVLTRAPDDLGDGRSVLSAYWSHRGDLILDEVLGGTLWTGDERYADEYLDDVVVGGGGTATRRLRPRREAIEEIADLFRRGEVDARRPYAGEVLMHEAGWEFRESADRLAALIRSWANYRMWGVYYKAPLFAATLRHFLGPTRAIDLVEHGGDVGLIPMQLMLEDDLAVRSAINAEISSAVVIAGRRIRDHFGDRLRGRYRYAIGPSEDFAYPGDVDAVSFTQCMLYMRRDRLEIALRTAYEHLRPGGVLMLLENTAPPTSPPGRDSRIIFSPDELDAMVSRIAPIHYLRVKDARPCTQADAATMAVLRVLVRE